MSNYYCNVCDKSIKIETKKKIFITGSHRALYMFINNSYHVENPQFFEIEDTLKKHTEN